MVENVLYLLIILTFTSVHVDTLPASITILRLIILIEKLASFPQPITLNLRDIISPFSTRSGIRSAVQQW
jgi:hypothetical protein